MKPPKNKPMDDVEAKEKFEQTALYNEGLTYFMNDQGYSWSHSENMWVDDGSLALEWADGVNDERKLADK